MNRSPSSNRGDSIGNTLVSVQGLGEDYLILLFRLWWSRLVGLGIVPFFGWNCSTSMVRKSNRKFGISLEYVRFIGIVLIYGITCLIAIKLHAQEKYELQTYSPKNGLVHRNIRSIHQSSIGRLWIGTLHGISYFDGYQFKTFLHADTLLSGYHYPACFFQDDNGSLWAIPYNQDFSPFKVEQSGGQIQNLYESQSGSFHFHWKESQVLSSTQFEATEWGSTFLEVWDELVRSNTVPENIIREFNLNADKLTKFSPIVDMRIKHVIFGREGRIWFWLNGAAYVYFDVNQRQIGLIKPRTIQSQTTNKYLFPSDNNGDFWFPDPTSTSTGYGLSSFRLPEKAMKEGFDGGFVDYKGNIWIYKWSRYLIKYDLAQKTFLEIHFPVQQVESLFEDRQGVIWIGTESLLQRIIIEKTLFKSIGNRDYKLDETAPIGHSARQIIQMPNGKIFFTTDNSGVFEFDPDTGNLKLLVYADGRSSQQFHTRNLSSVKGRDYDKTFFLAGSTIIYKYHVDTKQLAALFVQDKLVGGAYICPGANDHELMLLTHDYDLLIIDVRSGIIKSSHKISYQPSSILSTQFPVIYFSIPGGVYEYNLETKQGDIFFALSNKFDPALNDIRSLVLTDTIAWLGTFNGLYGYDYETTRQVKYHFTKKNGLPGNIIYSMVNDGFSLWLGTDNGLAKYTPSENTLVSFFEIDGLPHYEFNSKSTLIDRSGTIFMGGLNGLTYFKPDTVKQLDTSPAELIINEVRTFDRKLKGGRIIFPDDKHSIVLKSSEQSFKVDVSFFSFSKSENNVFKWFLEGLEPEWINTSNTPEIQYYGLSPGNYKLRIKAFSFRGIPCKEEVQLDIKILQVWYLQPLFLFIWMAIAGSIIYILIRLSFKRRLERQKYLQLRELDQAKEKLFTGITHEIRTPLTIILGMTDEIEQQVLKKGLVSNDLTRSIRKNAKLLLGLVNQILDLARLESGKMSVSTSVVDLHEQILLIKSTFQSIADKKEISIQYRKEVDVLPIETDESKVQQILSNLISNAIKFCPNGSIILITCRLFKESNHSKIGITVTDNGPGIHIKDQEKIFDRFFRGESAEQAQIQGSGIGLALSKEMAQILGGTLLYTSVKGGGASFDFVLPYIPKENIVQNELNQFENDKSYVVDALSLYPNSFIDESHEDHQKDLPIVLVIEDNEEIRNYIKLILSPNYAVIEAVDGQQGLDLARYHLPDIIISDVMMPIMDGMDLCKQIKQTIATSHIPFILLTAKVDQEARFQGLGLGADAYLTKPFNKVELLYVIENMLRLIQKSRERYLLNEEKIDAATLSDVSSLDNEFMQHLQEIMEANHTNENFSIEDLSHQLYLSRSQFFRKLKALTGQSPSIYLRTFRLHKAKILLDKNPTWTLAQIANEVGFGSTKYFSNAFYQEFGMRPRQKAK
jgi:signal transduction histidine kinase/DNA-binding response OmpR family regulator